MEGIMQVFKNAPVNDGDTDWASVTVRINEDQIYVAQMMVTIRDDLNETIYSKVCVQVLQGATVHAYTFTKIPVDYNTIWHLLFTETVFPK